MTVFGRLDVTVHQNPEEFLEENPEAEEQLVGVARSAFSKADVPTVPDAEAHLRTDKLVTAETDGEYQAFSGYNLLEPENSEDGIAYLEGVAVDEYLHGEGVGSVVMTRGARSLSLGPEEPLLGFRTQNPKMYGMADLNYELVPHPEQDTPEEMEQEIQALAEAIDDSKEMDGAVMREAYSDIYDGGMYAEQPDGSFEQFMYGEEQNDMSFEDGDALVVVGEIGNSSRTYKKAASRCSFDVHEHGSEVSDPYEKFNWVHGPRD